MIAPASRKQSPSANRKQEQRQSETRKREHKPCMRAVRLHLCCLLTVINDLHFDSSRCCITQCVERDLLSSLDMLSVRGRIDLQRRNRSARGGSHDDCNVVMDLSLSLQFFLVLSPLPLFLCACEKIFFSAVRLAALRVASFEIQRNPLHTNVDWENEQRHTQKTQVEEEQYAQKRGEYLLQVELCAGGRSIAPFVPPLPAALQDFSSPVPVPSFQTRKTNRSNMSLLYLIPLKSVKDVQFTPGNTSSAAGPKSNASESDAAAEKSQNQTAAGGILGTRYVLRSPPSPPLVGFSSPASQASTVIQLPFDQDLELAALGLTTVRFTLATPCILDHVQLRGKPLMGPAATGIQIKKVRGKLHVADEYHLLPGAGYSEAGAGGVGSSAIRALGDSPSSTSQSCPALARQRFKVTGLVRYLEIELVGNLTQVSAAHAAAAKTRDENNVLKKMDFTSALSPSSSLADVPILKTSSTGNRFTLPRLNVPKAESWGLGSNDNSLSATGIDGNAVSEELLNESIVMALSGFRLDSTPVASHSITLLNLTSNIGFAAEEWERQQEVAQLTEANRNNIPHKTGVVRLAPFQFDLVELYQLSGLAFVNARSFISAAEMFRKAEERLLAIIHFEWHKARSGDADTAAIQNHRRRIRACLERMSCLELLVGDMMSENEHLFAKLHAYQMAITLLKAAHGGRIQPHGNDSVEGPDVANLTLRPEVQLAPGVDVNTGLLMLQPDLLETILWHLKSATTEQKTKSAVSPTAANTASSSVSPTSAAASAPTSSSPSPSGSSSLLPAPPPALQLSAYKSLCFLLDSVGSWLDAPALLGALSALFHSIPIPLPAKRAQKKSRAGTSMLGGSGGESDEEEDEEAEDEDEEDEAAQDSDEDLSFDSDEEKQQQQQRRPKTPETATAPKSSPAPPPAPVVYPSQFPMILSSVEKARRTHGATQTSDAYFRCLKSFLQLLPNLLAHSGETSGKVLILIANQMFRFFPPNNVHVGTIPTGNKDLSADDSEGAGSSMNSSQVFSRLSPTAKLLRPDFSAFGSALGVLTNATPTVTGMSTTSSADAAWNTLKSTLIQFLTVAGYSLKGDLLLPLVSIPGLESPSHAMGNLFGSLFVAMNESEEEVRKAAVTGWCMLRDAFPPAVSAVLSEPEIAASASGEASLEQTKKIISSFVDLVITALSPPPPGSMPPALASIAKAHSKCSTAKGSRAAAENREPLSPDLNPFASAVTSSSPPPNSGMPPEASPAPSQSSTASSSTSGGVLPPLELAGVMLDLTCLVARSANAALKRQRELVADLASATAAGAADSDHQRIVLQHPFIADEFARLSNFLSSLIEQECTLPHLRNLVLMQQYFNALRAVVNLTQANPLQPQPVPTPEPDTASTTSSISVEDAPSGVSLQPVPAAAGVSPSPKPRSPATGKPQLCLPVLPLSTMPNFSRRFAPGPAGSLQSDAVTYHAFLLPLIDIASAHCVHSCPSEELLQLLIVVLSALDKQEVAGDKQLWNSLVGFFTHFASWVPHSVQDDTFELFQQLLDLLAPLLSPALLKSILYALTNKYTVRSQAYRNARDAFVQAIVAQLLNARQSSAAGTTEPDFLYIDTVLELGLLDEDFCSVGGAGSPPGCILATTFPPTSETENALAGMPHPNLVKPARAAHTKETQAKEREATLRFERQKRASQQKELRQVAIQVLATLIQVAGASGSAGEASDDDSEDEEDSSTALVLSDLLDRFETRLKLQCYEAITSHPVAENRLDAVVVLGLLQGIHAILIRYPRRRPQRGGGAAGISRPLIYAFIWHGAIERGVKLCDGALTHAALLHAQHALEILNDAYDRETALEAARNKQHEDKADAQKQQEPAALSDSLRRILETRMSILSFLLPDCGAVLFSPSSSVEVRSIAQWVLARVFSLGREVNGIGAAKFPTLGNLNSVEQVAAVWELLFKLAESTQASNRLAALRALAIAASFFKQPAAAGASGDFLGRQLPPNMTSAWTPFQPFSSSGFGDPFSGGNNNQPAIDSLSAIQDFSRCATDLEFFISGTPGNSKTSTALKLSLDALAAGSLPDLYVPALSREQMDLTEWFRAAPALRHPNAAIVAQLKSTLARLRRDWNQPIARIAKVIYEFFEHTARAQQQASSSAAAGPAAAGAGKLGYHAPVFHARIEWTDWLLLTYLYQHASFSTAILNSAGGGVPLPAPLQILFGLEQESAETAGLGSYSAVLHSLGAGVTAGGSALSVAPVKSKSGKDPKPFPYESLEGVESGNEFLYEHVARVYSFAVSRRSRLSTDADSSEKDSGASEGGTEAGEDGGEDADSDALSSGLPVGGWAGEEWNPNETTNLSRKNKSKKNKEKEKEAEKKRMTQSKYARDAVALIAARSSSAALSGNRGSGAGAHSWGLHPSPHAAWKSHVVGLSSGDGTALVSPLNSAELDALFYRNLQKLIRLLDEARESSTREKRANLDDTRTTIDGDGAMKVSPAGAAGADGIGWGSISFAGLASAATSKGGTKSKSSKKHHQPHALTRSSATAGDSKSGLSRLGLGGAIGIGGSIAEELDRMARALEQSVADEEEEEEDEFEAGRARDDEDQIDDDAREFNRDNDEQEDDEEEEEEDEDYPRFAGASRGNKRGTKSTRREEDEAEDEEESPPVADSGGIDVTFAKETAAAEERPEDIDDEQAEIDFDDYEDDLLVDDSDISGAAPPRGSSKKKQGPKLVSAAFAAAIKQTAKEYIESLKTSGSSRPRTHQSAAKGTDTSKIDMGGEMASSRRPKTAPSAASQEEKPRSNKSAWAAETIAAAAPASSLRAPESSLSPENAPSRSKRGKPGSYSAAALSSAKQEEEELLGAAAATAPAGTLFTRTAKSKQQQEEEDEEETDALEAKFEAEAAKAKASRPVSSRKRPESAGRRRQNVASADAEMDELASRLKKLENRYDAVKALAASASAPTLPASALGKTQPVSSGVSKSGGAAARPASASETANKPKISLPRSSAGDALPISSAVKPPASAGASLPKSVPAPRAIPVPVPIEEQVMVEEFEEVDQSPQGNYEVGTGPLHTELPAAAKKDDKKESRFSLPIGQASSFQDEEPDALTFSVHLASKDAADSAAAAALLRRHVEDEEEEDDVLNRTSSSISSTEGEATTPTKFKVEASDEQEEEDEEAAGGAEDGKARDQPHEAAASSSKRVPGAASGVSSSGAPRDFASLLARADSGDIDDAPDAMSPPKHRRGPASNSRRRRGGRKPG
jgi:hypothetical protein